MQAAVERVRREQPGDLADARPALLARDALDGGDDAVADDAAGRWWRRRRSRGGSTSDAMSPATPARREGEQHGEPEPRPPASRVCSLTSSSPSSATAYRMRIGSSRKTRVRAQQRGPAGQGVGARPERPGEVERDGAVPQVAREQHRRLRRRRRCRGAPGWSRRTPRSRSAARRARRRPGPRRR